jgi:AmmeMemoRadiSam system protein A
MSIVFRAITPHPPILLREIGGKEVDKIKNTELAMKELAERMKKSRPEVLLIISPHGMVFSDALGILAIEDLIGNLSNFGKPSLQFHCKNDLSLVQSLVKAGEEAGLPVVAMDEELASVYNFSYDLDHGVLIPLNFFLEAGIDVPLIPMSIGMLPYEEMYAYGKAIAKACDRSGKRVAFVASGDLSHRLTKEAPAGYHPRGEEFDREVQKALQAGDVRKLVQMERGLIECAGECGLRPIITLLGTLDGYDFATDILSYEGPFGVGYMVASLEAGAENKERELLGALIEERSGKIKKRRQGESPYVKLARTTLESYVREGKKITPPPGLPEGMKERAGVFVSIKKYGQLRGCIGTFAPTTKSIAHEIIQNAISAGTRDPRFPPVEEDELDQLTYSVDILSAPVPVKSREELDPKRYGIIVRKGHRSGLLLPNLEGVDTVDEQLRITKQKAGIPVNDQDVEIEKFEVVRYE